MCTIAMEALTPLDRTSRMTMYRNDARSRLFCRIAKVYLSLLHLSRKGRFCMEDGASVADCLKA